MFLFLVVALAVVVTATTLAVVGGGDRAVLPDAPPDRLHDPLPAHRAATAHDVEVLRFPPAFRGYRMGDVDDVLTRLAHELAERDERIASLESTLDTVRADAARTTLLAVRGEEREDWQDGEPVEREKPDGTVQDATEKADPADVDDSAAGAGDVDAPRDAPGDHGPGRTGKTL
jgi:DivIVA domain-containing protein